jgi:hypothetical protein
MIFGPSIFLLYVSPYRNPIKKSSLEINVELIFTTLLLFGWKENLINSLHTAIKSLTDKIIPQSSAITIRRRRFFLNFPISSKKFILREISIARFSFISTLGLIRLNKFATILHIYSTALIFYQVLTSGRYLNDLNQNSFISLYFILFFLSDIKIVC